MPKSIRVYVPARFVLGFAICALLVACATPRPSATLTSPIPTELPPPSLASFWTVNGVAAPRNTIQISPGPEACGLGALTMLSAGHQLGEPMTQHNVRQYVRDPGNQFRPQTQTDFLPSVARPPDAFDTGYRFGRSIELWASPADDRIFIVRGGIWEQWPRAQELFGCA